MTALLILLFIIIAVELPIALNNHTEEDVCITVGAIGLAVLLLFTLRGCK